MVKNFRIQILLVVFSLVFSGQLISQEFKTIFDTQKPVRISGFGGPIVEFSGVDGSFATSVGGGGAMILNNFFIGGYGMGLATAHYKNIATFDPYNSIFTDYSNQPINFGHGGFWIGGNIKPTEAIHLAFSAKIGWGSIGYMDEMNNYHYYKESIIDNVFVFTPQAEVEFNMARWFKVNLGVGYRMVAGTDLTYNVYTTDLVYGGKEKYFENSEFSSFTGAISLLFGGF
jgi:hypothetical protein